jgi:hypothetical protein
VRTDCGGCHAHSQEPTLFEDTAAAKPGYAVFDLTKHTPLLTTKERDDSGKKWDAQDETGLRYEHAGLTNVEYFRDVKPIFQRSCVACHTKSAEKPAGNLVLDDDDTIVKAKNPAGLGFEVSLPGTYARLAADAKGEWGHPPLHRHGWTDLAASRYVRQMQARRSLLIWKVFGRRMDGWRNDDFPFETTPGDPTSLQHQGQPVPDTPQNREKSHVGYTGGIMPPPKAVERGKVKPLSDEDRLTLVRWIDLGCPIDLRYDPANPDERGDGWMLDDQRPTLALSSPVASVNAQPLREIRIGLHDAYSGLDADSLSVTASIAIDDAAAGEELASRFERVDDHVWAWTLQKPLASVRDGELVVSVRDRQSNTTTIRRTFSVK